MLLPNDKTKAEIKKKIHVLRLYKIEDAIRSPFSKGRDDKIFFSRKKPKKSIIIYGNIFYS